MMKRAVITGINGQDGSYLAELLLEKEYEVYCYCLDYMIQLLLFCVVIEMLGIIGKELVFSSLFLLILIPMRSICGGIHAGMHLKREERMPISI